VWTDKNRAKYNRDHLRYPSDLTDDEWAYIGMLGAERLLVDRQRALEERPRRRKVAGGRGCGGPSP
jgi:putative transposase